MVYLGLLVILTCLSLLPGVWLKAEWPVWKKGAAHFLLLALATTASATLLA